MRDLGTNPVHVTKKFAPTHALQWGSDDRARGLGRWGRIHWGRRRRGAIGDRGTTAAAKRFSTPTHKALDLCSIL